MSAEVIKRLAALNLFLKLRHLNIAPYHLVAKEDDSGHLGQIFENRIVVNRFTHFCCYIRKGPVLTPGSILKVALPRYSRH
jgi:hypothetical protein